MPRKTVFDRNRVVQAALVIALEEGVAALTARRVARELGASVAPIYAHFATFEDLVRSVVQEITAMSQRMYLAQPGQDAFANIGLASLQFAREYPVLFQELVLTKNEYLRPSEALDEWLLDEMGRDETMSQWPRDARRRLLFKMKAVHLGIAALWATGQAPSWLDQAESEQLLMEVGDELLWAAEAQRGEQDT